MNNLDNTASKMPRTISLSEMTSQERKERPMARGLLDYFPDALAEVSFVSFVGNMKHNPGEELHWSKGKSDDHADCVIRHLASRGQWDTVEINGETYRIRHSAYAAWRALANLQIEIESENKYLPEDYKNQLIDNYMSTKENT